MKKIIDFYISNLLYVFRNKVRVFLTLLGCTIGLLAFSVGSMYISAYISKAYEIAYLFEDNFIVVWSDDASSGFVRDLLDYQSEEEYAVIGDYFFVTNKNYYYGESLINNSISMVGVDSNDFNSRTVVCTDSGYMVTGCTLLYGRGLSEKDNFSNKMAAVIEKSASQLLFQKDNSVGETIQVNTFLGYQTVEIVGVIDDLSVNTDYYLSISEQIDKKAENIESQLQIYVPLNLLQHYADGNLFNIKVLGFEEKNFAEAKETIEVFLKNLSASDFSVGINSRYIQLRDIAEEEQQINRVFGILTVILLVFVTLLMITVYFFSVKERVYEIGVRRAIGASKSDILIQFIFEGTFLSVLSALMTIVISVIFAAFARYISIKEFYMYYDFKVTFQLIGSVICLSVLQGLIFSIMPAILASKVDPTEAIRWE